MLDRVRGGDDDAARDLYQRYAHRLRLVVRDRCPPSLAPRVDADDILQSVFRTFFRRAQQGQFAVHPGEDLWALLLTIALNKVRAQGRFHRAERRSITSTTGSQSLEAAPDAADRRGPSSDDQLLVDLQMLITEIVEGLPKAHQLIIQRRLEGFNVDEIVAETGRSKRTVERLLHDFREILRDKLQSEPV
ncbi:MAG: RNA polymerase sigma factor [Planctomycetia bacterium]